MNKILKYGIYFIGAIIALQACQKDLQDELNSGEWNNERSVINLTLKNQVGKAEITRIDDSTGEITVKLNVDAIADMSKIEIEKMELSYKATASANIGGTLNFGNAERKSSLTVTSPTGKSREYTIYATEFSETLTGTYNINKLVVFGGTGPEYGGGRVYDMMDKPWCWNDGYAPSKEYDNVLTFTMDAITDDGNTSGTCINNAGADGRYADFIFKADLNPENHVDLDLKHLYRQIPEGESRWIRNYSAGTITFTDAEGHETTGTFDDAGNYDLGYGLSVNIPNNAFTFVLNGTDDWNNIYSDYDVFVKKVRKYYILVTKK